MTSIPNHPPARARGVTWDFSAPTGRRGVTWDFAAPRRGVTWDFSSLPLTRRLAAAAIAVTCLLSAMAIIRPADPGPAAAVAALVDHAAAALGGGSTATSTSTSGGNSLDEVRAVVGATSSSFDGTGIGVALIDTGVATVAGLERVVAGPNFSSDAVASDGFGHGTHLASIIAGNGTVAGRPFTGVAPDARLVSVDVADAAGDTHVARMVAALDWVVATKDQTGVRVVDLAFSAPAGPEAQQLSDAVERAWRAGVVVVVAAGNHGEITVPANSPYVINVGAVDTRGTVSIDDDVIASFSPSGTGARGIDLVAPGRSLVGLNAVGSVADREHQDAVIDGALIKGTGTSQ